MPAFALTPQRSREAGPVLSWAARLGSPCAMNGPATAFRRVFVHPRRDARPVYRRQNDVPHGHAAAHWPTRRVLTRGVRNSLRPTHRAALGLGGLEE